MSRELKTIGLKIGRRSYRKPALLISFFLLLIATILPGLSFLGLRTKETEGVVAKTVSSPFLYNFNSNGILEETWPEDISSSAYFWLSSGGRFIIESGVGKTIQGSLPSADKWRLAYLASNPLDTGNGFTPQNIFRLVTRSQWNNVLQEVKFKITKINMTDTPNRDGYSGILFFNRYKDSNNLYYVGLRMDGQAVIKKKVLGAYHTLAMAPVFSSDSGYEKDTNPNLIPGNRWIGMRSEVKDISSGKVRITLWLDKNNNGNWTQVITTVDEAGVHGGSPVITGSGKGGIRTDYLDVWFDDYRLTNI